MAPAVIVSFFFFLHFDEFEMACRIASAFWKAEAAAVLHMALWQLEQLPVAAAAAFV